MPTPNLKIGFDARLALRQRRGIGRSIVPLVRMLKQLAPTIDLICYVDRDDTDGLLQPWSTLRRLTAVPVPLWEQVILPLAARRDGCDLLHCPANSGPLRWPSERLSLTVNDLIFLDKDCAGQGWYQRLGRCYWAALVPRLVAQTPRLFTISETMRQPLQILASRVGRPASFPAPMVMHLACDPVFTPASATEVTTLRQRLNLRDPYFLCLGARDPRKRTQAAVRAFAHFRRSSAQPTSLVVTGGELPFAEGDSVRILPFVDDKDLRTLYTGARALLFLSDAEGFGLPPLEAMACGCPVIFSTHSPAVREVVGDAGYPVSVPSPEVIAAAMFEVQSNDAQREKIIQSGLLRVQHFSWDSAARQLLESWTQ